MGMAMIAVIDALSAAERAQLEAILVKAETGQDGFPYASQSRKTA
jgi:hypothetical protein